MSSAQEFVESKLKSKKVVVFSSTTCPYCTKAKQVLAKFGMTDDVYLVVELDKENEIDQIRDYLKQKTGARSVPRVFIGGECIGGGDDTVRLDKEGKLKGMLEKAGAI